MFNKNSFKHAYNSLPANKMREFREKMKTALNIQDYAFYARMRGEVEPKVSEAQIIEALFAEYGILDIWSETETSETNKQ